MQFNTANGSFLPRSTHIGEVVLIGNSSGGIINSFVRNGNSNSFTVGTTGYDFSVNKPLLPNTFQNFSNTGPYALYVFLTSTPANTARNNVELINNSNAQIVVIRDDGISANNTLPNNATMFSLSGGSVIGSQGNSWSSTTFKGRIQVYALSNTAQVAVMTD